MPAGQRRKIFFDGGCQPNPGAMSVAVVACGEAYFYGDLGHGSSTDAEWTALLLGLQLAQRLGLRDFDLVGDSREVIAQASGQTRCAPAAIHHLARYAQIAAFGGPRRLVWTPRAQNLAGIALARGAAGL